MKIHVVPYDSDGFDFIICYDDFENIRTKKKIVNGNMHENLQIKIKFGKMVKNGESKLSLL